MEEIKRKADGRRHDDKGHRHADWLRSNVHESPRRGLPASPRYRRLRDLPLERQFPHPSVSAHFIS
jgi:hypothetical protein